MKIKYLTLVWLPFLLLGCAPQKAEETPLHIVSRIHVEYTQNGQISHRVYDQSGHMEPFLTFLRLMENEPSEHNLPVDTFGPKLEITLQYWDGSVKRYRLQSDRYLCSDRFGWKAVSETMARQLREFVALTPSDQSFQKGSAHSAQVPARDLNCSS